ncbi:hypothetical protein CEXT_402911 [Caerostris extrusa]|uniref:Uncharacterized protein n=1 Tax=Caerostris extrusa TaxID=172846 RepID=A0AAV4QUH2_CAEEX|nr:hypothetical protein CEXT_402911 [Caerostris extrusa]
MNDREEFSSEGNDRASDNGETEMKSTHPRGSRWGNKRWLVDDDSLPMTCQTEEQGNRTILLSSPRNSGNPTRWLCG